LDFFYCASSMKQQFADRHVAPLGQLSRFRANQSLVFLLNAACLAEKQQIPILYSLAQTPIYGTQGEYTNHYTTDAVRIMITVVWLVTFTSITYILFLIFVHFFAASSGNSYTFTVVPIFTMVATYHKSGEMKIHVNSITWF
jgi:hypothetical protein